MEFGPCLQVVSTSIALGSHVGLSAILMDRVAAITQAGKESMGLVIPMTGLQWAPPPVMVVVQVDHKVDWKCYIPHKELQGTPQKTKHWTPWIF